MTHEEAINYERRLTKTEVTQDHILEALIDIKNSMNQRFDRLESRMDKMDSRMDKLDLKMDRIDSRLWSLVFTMFAGFGTVLGVVAHGLGWI